MKKTKILNYQMANRLKIEGTEEFSNSLFEEQYESAKYFLKRIQKNSKRILQSSSPYKNQAEKLCNVIPFLGGRGTGKTSAMLSFSNIFWEIGNCMGTIAYNKTKKCGEAASDRVGYFLLDYIDASLLGNNEGVLEVVLAKMWDYFDKETGKNLWNSCDDSKEKITEKLNALKLAYQNYKKMNSETNLSGIRQLNQLSVSINLRDAFRECVGLYLDYFFGEKNEGYLVLRLDDIDMAGKNSFAILEQLHQFLCIPRIIILLTADPKRLEQICQNYYREFYAKEEKSDIPVFDDTYEDRRYRENLRDGFVDDYLEKIIPSNLRVIMPNISTMKLQIAEKDGVAEDKLPPSDKILLQLYRMGIPFDIENRKHHFWEEKSLRATVNRLSSLMSAGEYENMDEHIIEWVMTGIEERLLRRVNTRDRQVLRQILNLDLYDLNQYLIKLIGDEIVSVVGHDRGINTKKAERYSYRGMDLYYKHSAESGFRFGDVLYGCHLFEELSVENREFVNVILAYYSVIYFNNDEADDRKEIFGDSLWGNWIEKMLLSPEAEMLYHMYGMGNFPLDNTLEIELIITKKDVEACFPKGKQGDEERQEGLKRLMKKILGNHAYEIMAFQICLCFFNSKLINSEDASFFEFRNDVHNADLKSGAPKNTKKEEEEIEKEKEKEKEGSDNNEGENQTEENIINSYEIKIKPRTGMNAIFGLENPLMDTDFSKIMLKHFKKEFERGVEEQLLEVVNKLLSDDAKNLEKQKKADEEKEISLYLIDEINQWKGEENGNEQKEKQKTENTEEKKNVKKREAFPAGNIQLTYNIGKKLEFPSVNWGTDGKNMYEVLSTLYTMIGNELQVSENYYTSKGVACTYAKDFKEFPVVKMLSGKSDNPDKSDNPYKEALEKILEQLTLRDVRKDEKRTSIL